MDLTVDIAKPGSSIVYLEHLHRLIALGARRILFFGLGARAVELLPRLATYSGSFELTLAVCDARAGVGEIPGVKARCLAPDAAVRERWDVVAAWDPATTQGAFAFASLVAARAGTPAAEPHVVYAAKRARAALVVALPKCGTHLASRVMTRLGYDVHVPPRVPEEIWPGLRDDPFTLPDNACFVPPGLILLRMPDKSIRAWHETKDPAVAFIYRDPRDALVSVVHYLMNEAKEPFTPTPPNLVHAAILKALPTPEARLLHAIEDETFPFRTMFSRNAWLLRHPLVQKVTFERLVGASGGGSDDAQVAEVRALMRHVGAPGDAAEIARSVFDRSQRTFFRGQIGGFKKEFRAEHVQAFDRHFREITARYGYDPDAAIDA